MNIYVSKKKPDLSERNESKGYTIVELLAVVAILVIISGVVTGILYSTLRGSNKSRISTDITQNGNYAISVIAASIIDARSVTQVGGVNISDCTASPSGTSITLRRISGGLTTFSCSNGTIASNSASLINSEDVTVEPNTCFFYCSQLSSDPYAIPIVGVTFKLTEKKMGLPESQSSAIFSTSVSLRNYSP